LVKITAIVNKVIKYVVATLRQSVKLL